jgi:hypothetical protein
MRVRRRPVCAHVASARRQSAVCTSMHEPSDMHAACRPTQAAAAAAAAAAG